MPEIELTKKIASFCVDMSYDDIPAKALETAKTALLDCLGVSLAGSTEECAKICSRLAQQEGAKEESTIFGQSFKSSAIMAAFANGTAGHALDFDHSFFLMGQPTSGLTPAIFSLGESLGVGGRRILESYVVGFEVIGKLAGSMPELSGRGGWHSPGTLGSLGATVACAKLLGLDPGKIQMAIGIASSMASGIVANFGTMTKPLHAGLGARNGVLAAKLASAGYTANPEPLGAATGFYNAYSRELPVDPSSLDSLGQAFELEEKGIKIKPYPCGGLTHAAIDAVLEMRARDRVTPETVESIDVDVTQHVFDRIVFKIPATGLQGKFSMGYLLSRALIDGRVSLDAFTDGAVRDQKILELAQKVRMKVDPSLEENAYGSRPCKVAILLKNGNSLSQKVNHPRGSREIPLSPEELRAKFLECSTRAISEKSANQVLDQLNLLENVNDIRPFCQLLSGNAKD